MPLWLHIIISKWNLWDNRLEWRLISNSQLISYYVTRDLVSPKIRVTLAQILRFFWLFHHTTDVVNWMWLLQVIDDLTITVALWPTAMTSQFRRLSLSTILLINLFHFFLLLMAYSSWALPRPVSTIDLSSTEWLPSSMPIFGGFRSTSLARC